MTTSLNKSAAFLLGFSFAFLPSFGPFLAVLFFLASRWTFNRSDLAWGAAALFSALSLGVHTGMEGFAFGLLQIMGPWLVYRAFFHLRRVPFLPANAPAVTGGLVTGLAVVVGAGWLQTGQLNFAYKTFTQAVIWSSSPAFYGHTVFVLGALVAVLTPQARFRFLGLGLSAVGILVAGSREAAVAWVFVTLVLFWVRRGRSKRSLVAEVGLLSVMLLVAAGLGPWFGWGRFGFLLDILPSAGDRNLIQGSEIANGDWWDTTWVEVVESSAPDPDAPSPGSAVPTLTRYEVTKKGADGWLRLQQVVPVQPGEPYTVSAWLRPEGGSQPGIQGWGQLLKSNQTFTLSAALVGDHWQTGATGPGRVLNAGIAAAAGDWRRVFVTFVYEGEPLLYWYVGLAPDARPVTNSSATFAGFQLEPGALLSDYTPGAATKGLSLGVARVPYWQAAWQGIRAKPWLGWGPGSFPEYYQTNWPNNSKLRSLPSHAHNFFLHVLFERGVVGFVGVALFILALLWGAVKTLDAAFLAVVLAVLFINVFDVTLFYGGVLYPLVAVAGWRAAAGSENSRKEVREGVTQQLGISLSLALGDFVMAYAALAAAFWVAHRSGLALLANPFSPVTYALLLWPVLSWREQLYPGYGFTPSQELRSQVSACTFAGLIFAVGTFLFNENLPLNRPTVLLTLLFSAVLLPLGRATLKRVFAQFGVWGRPVFILGAGHVGRRVAQALLSSPLDGLHPLAFFDDDPDKVGRVLEGLPVTGPLERAGFYAEQLGVQHAIVAVSRASPDLLTAVVQDGRAFTKVQFVPNLAGLPVFGVRASSLDKLLALELRNELLSPVNQFFKRLLDLLGVLVGGILLSPLVAVLCLVILADSRGPLFFGHKRVGKDGRFFKAWKFRTMVSGAQELLEHYLNEDPALKAEWEAAQKLQNDPRITRVGRFLRKYSLDELPQLWNVLLGEMSLVGPRPIVEDEIVKYGPAFELYKKVTPGLTGYWQVSGRSDTDYAYRVDLDGFYVRNWSVWLDIIILTKTPGVVLKGDGAY